VLGDNNCEEGVIFAESLTIRNMEKLKADLLLEFSKCSNVSLDFPPEAPVDFAGVQLICAARQYAASQAKAFRLARPAEGQLADVIQRGGFLEARSSEDLDFWRQGETAQ
jgi:hypothetical protein